jgi:ElaB/YqjD/DUF883 family membrane-anchored ribosome-binding protein
MAPTQSSNNYIQQGLDLLNQKFDNFIAALPNTYVTIRAHDVQIKAHEERINDNAKRLDAMEASVEAWKAATGKWSLDQHDSMRKEWTGEVKEANVKLDSVETNVIKLTEQSTHQTKILMWVLSVFTAITATAIGGVVVAFLMHLIHF